MALVRIELPGAEKLETLRRFDQFRDWQSLDEMRYCLGCAKLITGREIQVIGDTSEAIPLQVVCPTEHCNSIPLDWALPTGDILAALSPRDDNCSP
jgi:hypothetical protein